jgi:hypothetical protein
LTISAAAFRCVQWAALDKRLRMTISAITVIWVVVALIAGVLAYTASSLQEDMDGY